MTASFDLPFLCFGVGVTYLCCPKTYWIQPSTNCQGAGKSKPSRGRFAAVLRGESYSKTAQVELIDLRVDKETRRLGSTCENGLSGPRSSRIGNTKVNKSPSPLKTFIFVEGHSR
jgi:hypothetical protein